MKKTLLVIFALLAISDLFGGAFYPELTLNQSLRMIEQNQSNIEYHTKTWDNGPYNPFYGFDYIGCVLMDNYTGHPYGSFVTNVSSIIPRLVDSLEKVAKVKNHRNANSVLRFILNRESALKHIQDLGYFVTGTRIMMSAWKGAHPRVYRIVSDLIHNNRIDPGLLNEAHTHKFISSDVLKQKLNNHRKFLYAQTNIGWKQLEWLEKNNTEKTHFIMTGRLLLPWIGSTNRYRQRAAAEYYLKNMTHLKQDATVISNIVLAVQDLNLTEKETNLFKLKTLLIKPKPYLPYLIVSGVSLLGLLFFGYRKLKKK